MTGFVFTDGVTVIPIVADENYDINLLPANFYIEVLVNGFPESTYFIVDNEDTGEQFTYIDNSAPFNYPGNSTSWDLGTAEFKVKAEIYDLDNALGNKCDYDYLKFTIFDGSIPDCPCEGGLNEITFAYAGGGTVTTNSGTVTDNGDGTYTVSDGGAKLDSSLEISTNNNVASIHTSCSQDLLGITFSGGVYIIGYVDNNGNSASIADGCIAAPVCGDVTGFVFTDGVTVIPIVADENYDINLLPANFYIEVLVNGFPESTYFIVDNEDTGEQFTYIDNSAPFNYPGNSTSWDLGTAEFKVKAEIYDLDNALGNKCDYDYLKFTIFDGSIPDCPCEGGLNEITFAYAGGGTVTTNSGTVTDNGDGTYTVSNNGIKLLKDLEITTNGCNVAAIHTSCSQDTLGITFNGGVYVIGYVDAQGNSASLANGCNNEPIVCETTSAGTGTIVAAVVLVTPGVDFFVTVTPNGDAVIPTGYVLGTVLTTGTALTILEVSNTTTIKLPEIGENYKIHMLAFDPLTLDLNDINLGTTTAFDILTLIADGDICADLEQVGIPIMVIVTGSTDKVDVEDTREETIEPIAQVEEINVKAEEDNLVADIKLYPNPVVNQLNVDLILFEGEVLNYNMVDLNGKQVLTGSLSNNTNVISTKDLAPGLYILKLKSEGRSVTKKILVRK